MEPKNPLAAGLVRFLRTLGELLILNLLWVLCSLPVFTFGPASSALCSVTMKLRKDASSSVIKDFFAAFRRDFGQAVVLGLIGLVGLVIAAVDFRFAVSLEGAGRTVYLVVAVLVSAVVLSYLAYIFALHSGYSNSTRNHIKNALAAAAVNPKETVLIWLCFAVPILAVLFLPELAVLYLASLYIMLGVSVPAYLAAGFQLRAFARFDQKKEK